MPYTAPSSKNTGDLISANDWNQNTITNVAYVKGRLDYGKLWLINGTAAVTNGATNNIIETTSDKVNITVADFDAATIEYKHWQIAMPDDYDGGTVTYKVYYTHTTGTTDLACIWTLEGVSFADGETLDLTFGTGVDVTKTSAAATANILHVTDESGAVTIAGTPAAGELVVFRLSRKASDGSDTLTVDARLIGVLIKYGRS